MSIYKSYSNDQLENHLSQFLVNRWSYSSASAFARNQKAFEMQYIYGYRAKSSATTIAGQAYHKAVETYFSMMKQGEILPDLVTLETIAYDFIEGIDVRDWKLQKTTPSISECISKANTTASDLIKNFLKDISVYTDEIEEIIDVEYFGKDEFVTINGVDIPLPLSFKIDLVIKTKSGKIVIIDHKSKGSYTDEAYIKLASGNQAITYVVGYESKKQLKVDEVWFIENKYTQNRDKSPQLIKFIVSVEDDNDRKYYEAMLYESIRGMILAVNNPDYVYIMNDSDNLSDLAEMYEFRNKTLLAEVEDFNIEPNKVELVAKRLKKIKDSGIKTINPNVIKKFRKNAAEFIQYDYSNKDMTPEEKIEHVLRRFEIIAKVEKKFDGFSSDSYLLRIDAGTKINSIQSRRLDLANALDVSNVRIGQSLTIWEGKAFVQIDVSKKRDKDLIFNKKYLVDYKIPIGMDNLGNIMHWDLANQNTPHALICGSTGSGKSVELKCIIEYAKLAGVKQIIIFDPKFEFLSIGIKGAKIISEIIDIEEALEQLVEEMNARTKQNKEEKTLVIIDELADIIAQSRKGKELDIMEMVEVGQVKVKTLLGERLEPKKKLQKVGTKKTFEENLQILAQKGRSAGFRIAIGLQRASAKIVNGDIKANFTTIICFRLPKELDSRVVLDEPGAESLAGAGDGLIRSPEYTETTRFQAFYKP